ncbi:MAG: orotidine-5'-phosphate decarboxylase [Candidatus Bathyarchaeia archaeon]
MRFKSLIEKISKTKSSNLIVALDLNINNRKAQLEKCEKIIESIEPFICAIKVNMHLLLPLGLYDGVKRLVDFSHKLDILSIMDFKINDIGDTNKVIAEHCFKVGFDAITANPFIGWKNGLEPVVNMAKELGKGVILLCYMSHEGAKEGYGQIVLDPGDKKLKPQYEIFCKKAIEWDVDGVIVGATYLEKLYEISKILEEKIPIYSPGIGFQGGNALEAIKAGASYLIIGRSIILSSDPSKAVKEIYESVKPLIVNGGLNEF